MSEYNICKFNPVRSGDLSCTDFVYEVTDCQSEPHTAPKNALHLVIKGEGLLEFDGERYGLSKGTLFFVKKGECVAIKNSDRLEYSYICFSGRRAEELLERVGISANRRCFDGHERLIPFWSECISSANDSNTDLLSESVLLYSLAVLEPEITERGRLISDILTLTAEKFTDHTLTLSAIARKLGYNEKYLSAYFKREMGVTFTQYLRDMRVNHAVFLMEQGVVSVKNVALLSGFFDALYFSRVFKEEKGVSPREYIANLETFSFKTD